MMRWKILLLTIISSYFLSCGKDDVPFGLGREPGFRGRGDDGRELVYEWTDPRTGERVNLASVSISPDAHYAVFTVGYRDYLGKLDLVTKKNEIILHEDIKSTNWSYDGQWIAFHHDGYGFFDISIIRPDGTDRRYVITDPSSSDSRPIWFHHSNKFVYEKYYLSESTREAAVYDLNNDESVTITDPYDKWEVYPMAVSPDDEWIAAAVCENKVITDPWVTDPWDSEDIIGTPLAIIRTDGSECIWIIGNDEVKGYSRTMDWSPDGRYTLCIWYYPYLRYIDHELWTYDLETGDLKQITMAPPDFPPEDSYFDYEKIDSADWASDGYIYFTNNLGLLYRIRAPIQGRRRIER